MWLPQNAPSNSYVTNSWLFLTTDICPVSNWSIVYSTHFCLASDGLWTMYWCVFDLSHLVGNWLQFRTKNIWKWLGKAEECRWMHDLMKARLPCVCGSMKPKSSEFLFWLQTSTLFQCCFFAKAKSLTWGQNQFMTGIPVDAVCGRSVWCWPRSSVI